MGLNKTAGLCHKLNNLTVYRRSTNGFI